MNFSASIWNAVLLKDTQKSAALSDPIKHKLFYPWFIAMLVLNKPQDVWRDMEMGSLSVWDIKQFWNLLVIHLLCLKENFEPQVNAYEGSMKQRA